MGRPLRYPSEPRYQYYYELAIWDQGNTLLCQELNDPIQFKQIVQLLNNY